MSKPITKAELVAEIATAAGIANTQANQVLDATIAVISARLIAGDTVSLPGLAKFETRDRPARQVRNVATGAMMDKGADRAVKITALSKIKADVNA